MDIQKFGYFISSMLSNFAVKIKKTMDSKITLPDSVCRDEVVDYIASRYSITPKQVISHFLMQEGIIAEKNSGDKMDLCFEENEMTILRDMGIRPSHIEFIETTI